MRHNQGRSTDAVSDVFYEGPASQVRSIDKAGCRDMLSDLCYRMVAVFYRLSSSSCRLRSLGLSHPPGQLNNVVNVC